MGFEENVMDTNIIPYGKFCIDSSKFLIDKDLFTEVNIPDRFTLVNADTGEVLKEWKANSFEIAYKSHKIYIANVRKVLGNKHQNKMIVDKVLIYFTAKVFGEKYFEGITEAGMSEVLEFLKSEGYLIFDDIKKIIEGIHCKDLDIKIDLKRGNKERKQVDNWFKDLRGRFQGQPEDIKHFKYDEANPKKKNGFGLQVWSREKSTLTRPFAKWYDKSIECLSDKHKEWYNSISKELQREIKNNFILRWEFTCKDIKFFRVFEMQDTFSGLLYTSHSKYASATRYIFKKAFEEKPKRIKDISKLTLEERFKMILILFLHEKKDMTKGGLIKLALSIAKDKGEKYRMKKRFERWWSIATTPHQYTAEAFALVENVNKWDGIMLSL